MKLQIIIFGTVWKKYRIANNYIFTGGENIEADKIEKLTTLETKQLADMESKNNC
ncbi:MAG: hypothetical protein ACRCZ9_07005 [Fusobacteriaceae bacterium]